MFKLAFPTAVWFSIFVLLGVMLSFFITFSDGFLSLGTPSIAFPNFLNKSPNWAFALKMEKENAIKIITNFKIYLPINFYKR